MACGGLTYLRAPSERMIGLLLRTPAAARSRRCREGPEFLFSRCTDWVRAARCFSRRKTGYSHSRRTTNPGAGYEHHSLDCSRPARQITDSRQAATGPCVPRWLYVRIMGVVLNLAGVLGLAMPRQACASGMRSRRWVVPSLPGGPPPSDDLTFTCIISRRRSGHCQPGVGGGTTAMCTHRVFAAPALTLPGACHVVIRCRRPVHRLDGAGRLPKRGSRTVLPDLGERRRP